MIMMVIPLAFGATTSEPILFENVGEVISGLSYVHSIIPVDVQALDQQAREYQASLEREFSKEQLERTYREFVSLLRSKTKVNTTSESLNFDRSALQRWHEIGLVHISEIQQLRDRIEMLYETLPPIESLQDGPTGRFDSGPPKEDPWNRDFKKNRPPEDLNKKVPILGRRSKRNPVLVVGAVAVLGGAGTAFGIYNTVQISQIWSALEVVDKKLIAFQQTMEDYSKDIMELQDEVHGMLLKQLTDSAFDTGTLVSKLRTQYTVLRNRIRRYFNVMQMAQVHRLAVDFLDEGTLKKIYNVAKYRARTVNCVLLIRQPSDLFQLEVSYSFDGKKVAIMIHIPIAAPDSTLRLYKLHPFPLPFSNDTFLIPAVTEDLLAISNNNHRYTLQLTSNDLVGCNRLGRTYFCERNGLLYKYPEDTCLGALYHQRYDDAKSLCSFTLEPAREFVRQLKDNWYLVYSEQAQTIPMLCANKSFSELHIRAGASKFHLSAGCTADLPRHRLISDMSVLIPSDYVQFEMEWDPHTFLPELRDFVLPEFHRLQRYGQSRIALSNLQSVMAYTKDSPSWWHNIHFSGDLVTVILVVIVLLLTVYRCLVSRARKERERRGRLIEDAVRTALNAGTPRQQQLMLPMVTHPPSTVVSYQPTQPVTETYTMTRPSSYTNLSSVSDQNAYPRQAAVNIGHAPPPNFPMAGPAAPPLINQF